MNEPQWLTLEQVKRIHSEQLVRHGGPSGLRDAGLLESALARPINKFQYGETNLAVLAAAYAYGLARNHPFVDGNKRIAFMATVTFLAKNGYAFEPDLADATRTFFELAAGVVTEPELSAWIARNSPA